MARYNLFSEQTAAIRQTEGQTAIEFALTSIVLFLLIFGLIDFGRAVYTASVVEWAAQEGARAGIVDTSDIVPVAEAKMILLDPARATITFVETAPDIVEVQIVYDFQFIAPVISNALGGGIELTSSASMVGH